MKFTCITAAMPSTEVHRVSGLKNSKLSKMPHIPRRENATITKQNVTSQEKNATSFPKEIKVVLTIALFFIEKWKMSKILIRRSKSAKVFNLLPSQRVFKTTNKITRNNIAFSPHPHPTYTIHYLIFLYQTTKRQFNTRIILLPGQACSITSINLFPSRKNL